MNDKYVIRFVSPPKNPIPHTREGIGVIGGPVGRGYIYINQQFFGSFLGASCNPDKSSPLYIKMFLNPKSKFILILGRHGEPQSKHRCRRGKIYMDSSRGRPRIILLAQFWEEFMKMLLYS
jgi:hypothetical protein